MPVWPVRSCVATPLCAETDVIRCKLYSLLLPAYLLLGEEDEFDRLRSKMRSMLPVIKAGQSRALLLVTLYGCTDSSLYQRMAHELVDPLAGGGLAQEEQDRVDTSFT